jgi:cytochrome c-type biogenesis protein CcmH
MIWVLLVALTIIAAAVLVLTLLRPGQANARAAYDVEIHKDQLKEIDRDVRRGVIDAAEAEAARREIARKLLAAADANAASSTAPSAKLNYGVLIVVALAPVAALALYLSMGSPLLPGQPLSARTDVETPDKIDPQIVDMVTRLAERLKSEPDNLQGWVLLARSYGTMNRIPDALAAWRRVMQLSPGNPEHAGPYGETAVQAANGTVTPEARAAFDIVLKAEPGDPRALFFIGLQRAQEGAPREALQIWTDLAASAPADAPWLPAVRERIRRVAAEARIDPATIAPSPNVQPPRGPSAADVEAAQNMAPAQQAEMIRGMVDRLAARLEQEPNDVEGWRRLGQAWRVLREPEKSKTAYAKAVELAPTRVDVLTDYATSLLGTAKEGDKLPDDFVAVLRRILALAPDHADALWFVGLAEAQAGNTAQAKEMWTRLLALLPQDAPERPEIEQRIDTLGK